MAATAGVPHANDRHCLADAQLLYRYSSPRVVSEHCAALLRPERVRLVSWHGSPQPRDINLKQDTAASSVVPDPTAARPHDIHTLHGNALSAREYVADTELVCDAAFRCSAASSSTTTSLYQPYSPSVGDNSCVPLAISPVLA